MQLSDAQELLKAATRINPKEWLTILNLPSLTQLFANIGAGTRNNTLLTCLNIENLSLPRLESLLENRILANLARFYRIYAAVLGIILLNAILTNWILLLTILAGYKGTRYLVSLNGRDDVVLGLRVGYSGLTVVLLVFTLVMMWWASPLTMIVGSLTKAICLIVMHAVFMDATPTARIPEVETQGTWPGPSVYEGATQVDQFYQAGNAPHVAYTQPYTELSFYETRY
jgi:hypothetical protein